VGDGLDGGCAGRPSVVAVGAVPVVVELVRADPFCFNFEKRSYSVREASPPM